MAHHDLYLRKIIVDGANHLRAWLVLIFMMLVAIFVLLVLKDTTSTTLIQVNCDQRECSFAEE